MCWHVRDDGSNDDGATLNIIKNYQSKYPERIQLIEGNNIGWKKSFLELVRTASNLKTNFDFYAFCDQDDIWLPNKLSTATKYINTDSTPQLYCSNLYYYSAGKVGKLIKSQIPIMTLENSLIRNHAVGCTIVFNHALLDLLKLTPVRVSIPHDFWAYQVAMFLGRVYYDSNAYIWYRQHENNQIGAKLNKFARLKRSLRNLKQSLHDHTRVTMANELIELFGPLLTSHKKDIIKTIADCASSYHARFRLLTNKTRYFEGTNEMLLNTKIIFGKL